MSPCTLCPRDCRVQRRSGELGLCKAGDQLLVAAAFPHFGEEPPLSGQRGSGAIFISWCNLLCQFCQSWEVNHRGEGEPVSARELAEIMLDLQGRGCHNINFVTPTHYAPQLMAALPLAIEQGFRLPLVYNCGGYESLEVIQLLDGIVDIYLPDIKFLDPAASERYLDGAADYPEVVRTMSARDAPPGRRPGARCAWDRPARPHRPTFGDARIGARQPGDLCASSPTSCPSRPMSTSWTSIAPVSRLDDPQRSRAARRRRSIRPSWRWPVGLACTGAYPNPDRLWPEQIR